MISRALALALAFVTLLGASHAIAASAPSYPARPVRVIVPYAAGGSSDVLARIVGQRLSERLGQQFVVDNRAGAGTLIGTEIAANAAADGYTLLVATPPLVVNPLLYRKVSYAVDRDFAAVTNIAASSNLLVVHPSLTAASVDDLVTLLRSQPGKYTYGSSGVGGAGHLATALFAHMTGVDIVHVPYKGGAPMVADLLAGRLHLAMANLTTTLPHLRAGRLRALAIGTTKRSELMPDMPTLSEAGVPGTKRTTGTGLRCRAQRTRNSSRRCSAKWSPCCASRRRANGSPLPGSTSWVTRRPSFRATCAAKPRSGRASSRRRGSRRNERQTRRTAMIQPTVDVAHVIQLAVAPVFLLTGVGSLLSVMTNRLARVIDRGRHIEAVYGAFTPAARACADLELTVLAQRARLASWAINFSTAAALLVCGVIAMLFVDAFLGTDLRWLLGAAFIATMFLLTCGLICFLREVYVATHTVYIGPPR